MARTELTKQRARDVDVVDAAALRERTEAGAQARIDFASSGLPSDFMTTGLAGAGAGWVFGPVGGLIGAAVAATMAKKRRKGIIAQATADQATSESLLTAGERSVASLEANAATEQDKFEAGIVREQFNQAAILAQHPDPSVAANGFQALLSIPGLVAGEADEIEAAQLAREDKQRAKFETEVGNATSLRNRLQTESGAYIDGARQFDNINALLQADPSQLDAVTAIFSFAKLVNPGEITTEGDIQALSDGGNITSALASKLSDIVLGRAFMDDTIKHEILESSKDLMRTLRDGQVERNKLAKDFAVDQRIRPELIENILIPVNTGVEQLVPTPAPKPPPLNPDADLDENGQPLKLLEAFVTPGAIDARNAKIKTRADQEATTPEPFSDSNKPGLFDMSDAAIQYRNARNAERTKKQPGLFQPGGLFGGDSGEVNE